MQSQKQHKNAWYKSKATMLNSLAQIYKDAGVYKEERVLKRLEDQFEKLKTKKKSGEDKNWYFQIFDKNYKEKNHQMIVRIEGILPKKTSGKSSGIEEKLNTQNQEVVQKISIKGYRRLLFENHRSLIKFLERKRYSFKNIAKHSYSQEKSLKNLEQFYFEVEKGIDYGTEAGNWNCDSNIPLFFLFVRDVSRAIIQLQSVKIFHSDLHLRNILLFGCRNVALLQNPKEFAKIMKDIEFKVIDLGNALIMDLNNKQFRTREIIQMRKTIDDWSEAFEDPFYSYLQQVEKGGLTSIQILDQLLTTDQAYKKKHAQSFASVTEQEIQHILRKKESALSLQGQKKAKFMKDSSHLKGLIQGRRYSEVISNASKLAFQWLKK